MKDDQCGGCPDWTLLEDYAAMQTGIRHSGRQMVFMIEGQPDLPTMAMSPGMYGNVRRVGHDIVRDRRFINIHWSWLLSALPDSVVTVWVS